ncbi:MAG TPA: hypothetical protein VKV18_06170 [Chthonomonas sp.]|uniref:hypothetical protein n=1 Tax=Chthonomonas sp. TaxID=2282153 RepID=UPI002B4AFB14|nr:hypothetical protein [Chthonomonas sp.]HLI48262.1 hypothetical protein [Chthonomonas sp.]
MRLQRNLIGVGLVCAACAIGAPANRQGHYKEAYPSPNGQYIFVWDGSALYKQNGQQFYRFPGDTNFFNIHFTPWGEHNRFLYLMRVSKNQAKIVRFDVRSKKCSVFDTGGAVAASLVPSPSGRYIAYQVGCKHMYAPLLGILDTQAKEKQDRKVAIYPFRFYAERFAWVTDRLLFVHTEGKDLGTEFPNRVYFGKYVDTDSEDFLLDWQKVASKRYLLPFEISSLAPYADASGRLIGLARKDGKRCIVSIDPYTGENRVEKELPASKSGWFLVWSSPERVYVWCVVKQGEIEMYVYRASASPHVGARHLVEVPGALPWSWTTDANGRLWWFDGKGLKSVQLPLE